MKGMMCGLVFAEGMLPERVLPFLPQEGFVKKVSEPTSLLMAQRS